MKIVSIVGMAGSGKSEVARTFEEYGYTRIRFGDSTDEEIKNRGLTPGEENERRVRELLRKEYGMDAYARLNLPRIDAALKKSNAVIDGLYSWEEYIFLKEYYGNELAIIAVWSPPNLRYARLSRRQIRPLTLEQTVSRDYSEIENSNKGGPIAMADFLIMNISSLEVLQKETIKVILELDGKTGQTKC